MNDRLGTTSERSDRRQVEAPYLDNIEVRDPQQQQPYGDLKHTHLAAQDSNRTGDAAHQDTADAD